MWKLFLHLPDRYLTVMGIWLVLLAAGPWLMLRVRRRLASGSRFRKLIPASLSVWMMLGLLTAIEIGYALFYDTTDALDVTNVSNRWFTVHVGDDLKLLKFGEDDGIYYRDDLEFPTEPDDRTHICFVGDSFTFGHGVPRVRDRFTNRLRQLSAERAAMHAEDPDTVISNLSQPGTDLYWVDTIVRNVLKNGWGVDHFVYVFCLNDIDSCDPGFASRSAELASLRQVPDTFLFRDTYFLNWVYFRTQLLARPQVQDYYGYVREFYDGPAWDRFLKLLAGVRDECRAHEVRFTVVVFPFLHNLGPTYPFREIHAQISAGCADLQIPVVDLEPVLNRHAGQTLTVNPFDAHPNERAHAIVAGELYRKLILPGAAGPVPADERADLPTPSLERVSDD